MKKHFNSAVDQIKADQDSLAMIKEKANNSESKKSKISSLWTRKHTKYAMAASIGLLFVGGFTTYMYKSVPVSYVSVDVNPSVELAVSRSGEVTDVYSYNEDGDVVLESADVVGMELDDAVDSVVTSALNNGYIKEDGSSIIVITPETDDESEEAELAEASKDGAVEAISEPGASAGIYVNDAVDFETREEAIEAGVSPGKYDVIMDLQELDPTATIEEYADASMDEIIGEIEEIDPDYGLDIEGGIEEVDPGYDIDVEEGVDSGSDSTEDDRNNSVNNDNNNGNIGNGGDNGNDDNNGNDDSNNVEGNNGNGNDNDNGNGNSGKDDVTEGEEVDDEDEVETDDSADAEASPKGNEK